MSEVVDRPPTVERPPANAENLQPQKPPGKYHVEAWSGGHVCGPKFAIVLRDVFQLPMSVAVTVAETIQRNRRVPVALGLTREVAEAKADRASQAMAELVGDCGCGHRIKFMPIPAAD